MNNYKNDMQLVYYKKVIELTFFVSGEHCGGSSLPYMIPHLEHILSIKST